MTGLLRYNTNLVNLTLKMYQNSKIPDGRDCCAGIWAPEPGANADKSFGFCATQRELAK